jgi:hypothetical protein
MFARGGPHSTDSLYYLDASLNNLKDPFILNRYMHVFIQKLFVEVFSSPLVGAQFFWAFEVAITGGLVYWAARSFSRKSNLIHGILAILIFFSAPALGNYAGTPLVDISNDSCLPLIIKDRTQESLVVNWIGFPSGGGI